MFKKICLYFKSIDFKNSVYVDSKYSNSHDVVAIKYWSTDQIFALNNLTPSDSAGTPDYTHTVEIRGIWC